MAKMAIRLLLCSFLLTASSPIGLSIDDGPLNNGDFEALAAGGNAADITVPGWTTSGAIELVESGQKQGAMIIIVPQGMRAVRLGNDAQVRQELAGLDGGAVYAVTFAAARTCATMESLNISAIPAVAMASPTVDLQTVYSVEGWDAYAWAFQAATGVSGGAALSFQNPGMEDDPTCGPVLDNIAIKKLFRPPPVNGVVNGDFEEGPWVPPNASLGVLLPFNLAPESSPLPGWTVESDRAVRFIDSNRFSVPQGKRAVELLSGKEGILSQIVRTTPGRPYTLSFSVGPAGDACEMPLAVSVFAGDQTRVVHLSPPDAGNLTSQPASLNFTASADQTRIAFHSVYYNTRSDDRSSLCGPVVDDVRLLSSAAHHGPPAILVLLTLLVLVF
ncbi:choice-of-anchor C domain protein, putative (Protein of unknown function, DUF642) [Wolffia australiana]